MSNEASGAANRQQYVFRGSAEDLLEDDDQIGAPGPRGGTSERESDARRFYRLHRASIYFRRNESGGECLVPLAHKPQ